MNTAALDMVIDAHKKWLTKAEIMAAMAAAGWEVTADDPSNHGRIDWSKEGEAVYAFLDHDGDGDCGWNEHVKDTTMVVCPHVFHGAHVDSLGLEVTVLGLRNIVVQVERLAAGWSCCDCGYGGNPSLYGLAGAELTPKDLDNWLRYSGLSEKARQLLGTA